jgi:hypothetical protein
MRNWVRNHERISAAIFGLLVVITMVWRLGANATTPAPSCELKIPQNCAEVIDVARAEVGIAAGATVRIVEPLGLPTRTSGDVGLVVVAEPDGARHLILVGGIGIDPDLHAWVPDRHSYATTYRLFNAE